MMRSFHFLLIALLVIVIAVGRWIAVGASEQVDQLLRDGRLEAAMPLLEDRYAHGKIRSAHLLRSLAYARIASGNISSGINLLKTSTGPDTSRIEVHAALKNSFDLNEYDRALATLEDTQALRERASLAALQGNIDRQREALLVLAKGNQITAQELIQLSAIQASSDDFYAAAMTMRRVEQLLPVKERVGLFIIELKLLVKDGKTNDRALLSRAKEFLATDKQEKTSQELVWNFIKMNRPSLSLELIDKPLADADTFNAYVAAKESIGRTDDVLSILLDDRDHEKVPKEHLLMVVHIAPQKPDTLLKALAAYERGVLPLSDEQMVEMAYASMQLTPQQTNAAEAVLTHLVEKRGAGHAAGKALRYLWGPRPSEKTLAWITKQARRDEPEVRGEWLAYLLSSGHMKEALEILRTTSGKTSPSPSELVLKGLPAISDTDAAKTGLLFIKEKEKNPAMLLRAAQTAKGMQLFDESFQLIEKSVSINPANAKALAFLGILAAQRNDTDLAVKVLSDLISMPKGLSSLSGQDQVLSQYLYGTALERSGHEVKAKAVYAKALDTLRAVYTKDFDIALQAELLAKVEGASQGSQLLLAQKKIKPLTESQRLLLGRLLTDAGRLDEARSILFEGSK